MLKQAGEAVRRKVELPHLGEDVFTLKHSVGGLAPPGKRWEGSKEGKGSMKGKKPNLEN